MKNCVRNTEKAYGYNTTAELYAEIGKLLGRSRSDARKVPEDLD